MELYLTRHGQSTNNRGDRPRGAESLLTSLGEAQARRIGVTIKAEGITRRYCNPMLRALRTAQRIGEILNLAPYVFVNTPKSTVFLSISKQPQ